jgi:hypothetical protein
LVPRCFSNSERICATAVAQVTSTPLGPAVKVLILENALR